MAQKIDKDVAFHQAEKHPAPQATTPEERDHVEMVWQQPNHKILGVGSLFRVTPEYAETLRKSGQARVPSEEEVRSAIATGYDIQTFDKL